MARSVCGCFGQASVGPWGRSCANIPVEPSKTIHSENCTKGRRRMLNRLDHTRNGCVKLSQRIYIPGLCVRARLLVPFSVAGDEGFSPCSGCWQGPGLTTPL